MEEENISGKPGKQHWSGHIIWVIVLRVRFFFPLKERVWIIVSLSLFWRHFRSSSLDHYMYIICKVCIYIYIYTSVSTTIFHLNLFIHNMSTRCCIFIVLSGCIWKTSPSPLCLGDKFPRQQMEQVRSKQLLGLTKKNHGKSLDMPDPIASMYGMRYIYLHFP